MKGSKWLVIAILAMAASAVRADSWTFTLSPPSGAISGAAGSTIGWGYSITNQSATSWLVLTSLSADAFLNATADASYFSFPIVTPASTMSFAFDPATLSGLFGITWDAAAPVGFTNIGTFVLTAEFWDGDPLAGGNFVSLAPDQSATYSATVTSPTRVPEPSSFLLLAGALVGVVFGRFRSTPPA